MIAISIHEDVSDLETPLFLCIAGSRRSTGRTAGEALDALIAQEGESIVSSSLFIQRFAPDAFFSKEQYERMKSLLARRNLLTTEENSELDALIDAELDATVERTNGLALQIKR